MLITELKAKETILSLITGKVFVLNCHGCKEIRFPEAEADALQAELKAAGNQLLLQSLCLMLGETDFLTAVAVDDEDLTGGQGLDGLFCFQFGNQHLTSSPLRRSCPA